MYLKKIISGGQNGADLAGLKAAKNSGLDMGGMMPERFKTLDGPKPEYEQLYGMKESNSPSYKARTFYNAKVGDATVRLAHNFFSPGEICTLNAIEKWGKPHYDILVDDDGNTDSSPRELADWLYELKIETLNVAGNSEQTFPGIEKIVYNFLTEVFAILKKYGEELESYNARIDSKIQAIFDKYGIDKIL